VFCQGVTAARGVTGGSPLPKKISAEGLTTIAHSFGVGPRLFMPNGGSASVASVFASQSIMPTGEKSVGVKSD